MSKKIPRIITQEEFEKIYEATLKKGTKRTKEKYRKYAFCLLLGFEAGLRIGEYLGLKYKGQEKWQIDPLTKDKIDFDRDTLTIKGKRGKVRIVSLPKRIKPSHMSLLPLNIPRRTFTNFITEISKKVLGKEVSPHTLRAGFATHLLDKGVPIHQVQLLMGHSRGETTLIYGRANPTRALESSRQAF